MKRWLGWVLVLGATAAVLLLGWRRWSPAPPGAPGEALPPAVVPGATTEPVPCYFPGRAGMDLNEETRPRPRGGSALDRLRGALTELHRGPGSVASLPVFPPGLLPRSVFLTPEGVAYLDEPAGAWDRPIGLREEMLIVRAIARTILRQCPEVRAIVFLTDGAPRLRLAAHCPAQGRYLLPRSRRSREASDADPPASATPRTR